MNSYVITKKKRKNKFKKSGQYHGLLGVHFAHLFLSEASNIRVEDFSFCVSWGKSVFWIREVDGFDLRK